MRDRLNKNGQNGSSRCSLLKLFNLNRFMLKRLNRSGPHNYRESKKEMLEKIIKQNLCGRNVLFSPHRLPTPQIYLETVLNWSKREARGFSTSA